jgi:non-ribosomal peptide synthetase component E (peptide arylation enzyme)
VFKPGLTLSLDALCAWFEGQGIAKLKWPERLVPIAEMPVTPTGKFIKSVLVKLVSE